jgi:gamma-glutamyltranspeptidase/glutathione hydrolase
MSGWEALHERHGSLPWPELFAPAIKLARYGFPVSQDLATYLTNQTFMLNDTNWSESFAPNGTLLGFGDTVYRKKYANALEKIANEGAGAFYNGSIAANTINKINQTGGIMTLSDLAGYTALVKNASSIAYR